MNIASKTNGGDPLAAASTIAIEPMLSVKNRKKKRIEQMNND